MDNLMKQDEATSKKMVIVDGVKMELDMRTAKLAQIDTFKVGDAVKVLSTEYSEPKVEIGCIVGFDNFKDNPTIIIATLDAGYSSANIKIHAFNKDSKLQIVKANENDLPYSKSEIVKTLDREITSKEKEIQDLKQKKEYFLKNFSKCFKFIKD